MDPTAILVENLTEALKQINVYVALGLATAVSALVLDHRATQGESSDTVNVPGNFIPMDPDTAKLVLLGICFVAGIMALYSAESATAVAHTLQSTPDLLEALCTYPSVATAPIPIRVVAALLPVAFVLPIILSTWLQLRKLTGEGAGGLIVGLGFFVARTALLRWFSRGYRVVCDITVMCGITLSSARSQGLCPPDGCEFSGGVLHLSGVEGPGNQYIRLTTFLLRRNFSLGQANLTLRVSSSRLI